MEGMRKCGLLQGSSGGPATRSWSLPTVSSASRLRYAGACVSVGLACGVLLSPALWLTRPESALVEESFPMVPPLAALERIAPPPPFDSILFSATLVLCALAAVRPRRPFFAALFCAGLLLALPDVLRWQPWFYLYTGMLGALAFVPQWAPGRRTRGRVGRLGALQVLRLMVGSVYFYSGLNKLNAAFFEERLSGFLAGMPPVVSDGPLATALTYSAPALEVDAGIGLLAGGCRVRHAALALAASTNLLVLVALISAGANVVVWPWNLAMIALIAILFMGRDEEQHPGGSTGSPRRPAPWRFMTGQVCRLYAAGVIILFVAAPAAGLLGYWPSYLSFALYSENTPEAEVVVDGHRASVRQLAYERLNVPAFPSMGVYEAAGERACAGLGHAEQLNAPALIVWSSPNILAGNRETRAYTCGEL